MEKHETKALLKILSAAYPKTYQSMGEEQKRELLALWHEMFAEYPGELVAQACKNYIRSNEFPPTIAGLTEQIRLLVGRDSAAEAFTALQKACRNGTYGAKEEFAKLPRIVQKWLGDAIALKELALLPTEKFTTVVRGEFLKSYPILEKQIKAHDEMPENVRILIDGMFGNLEGEDAKKIGSVDTGVRGLPSGTR